MAIKKQILSWVWVALLGASVQAMAFDQVEIKGKEDALSQLDTYSQFKELLSSSMVLSMTEIKKIPAEIKSLALYRMNDRRNRKLSEETYHAIEQLIITKLLENSRIDVKECLQCKTTRIRMAEDHFSVLRRVASNDKLAQMGTDLKVDGFLMWEAYSEEDRVFLNLRMVDSATGRFLWAKQYLMDMGNPMKWAFTSSLWGLTAKRNSTDGSQQQTLDSMLALGVRTVEETSLSEKISYGFGLNFFMNPAQRDYFDVNGLAADATVHFDLDSLISDADKPHSNYSVYAGLGQAFVSGTPAFLVKGGFGLRFNTRQSLNLGFIYMQNNNIGMIDATGYEATGTFGGFGYDLSLSIQF